LLTCISFLYELRSEAKGFILLFFGYLLNSRNGAQFKTAAYLRDAPPIVNSPQKEFTKALLAGDWLQKKLAERYDFDMVSHADPSI